MMRALGMGGHQCPVMGKDEWLTPPKIINALGVFDLDPCAPRLRVWHTAKNYFTIEDDGLTRDWRGRVWCNPPYGRMVGRWLARCANHGNAIALIFARTETEDFFEHVWGRAAAILFLRGRLFFHHVDGSRAKHNSGAPSCLVAYDGENAATLQKVSICGDIDGQIVRLR